MKADQIKISLIQADLAWEQTAENLAHFDRLLAQVPQDSEIVVLPEMFSTGFTMAVQNLRKPVGKEAFIWLQKRAAYFNKILVGSILTEENQHYFNRMFWMRPDGSFDSYDKRHLFHMGDEHRVMTAGHKRQIIKYNGRRFLLQICYDLRFPVWSRNTYDPKTEIYDYDALIYIANWPQSRRQAYLSLLKSRAIENQSLVIWVNRVGQDFHRNWHTGDSQIIDAKGNILTKSEAGKEMVNSFSLDFKTLDYFRNDFKVGLDWDKFNIF